MWEGVERGRHPGLGSVEPRPPGFDSIPTPGGRVVATDTDSDLTGTPRQEFRRAVPRPWSTGVPVDEDGPGPTGALTPRSHDSTGRVERTAPTEAPVTPIFRPRTVGGP